MISAKLAAVQKYCCFKRNSLPTENVDGRSNRERHGQAQGLRGKSRELSLTCSVVIGIQDAGDRFGTVRSLDSSLVISG